MIYTLENHELKHAVEEMLFHLLPTETLSRADSAEQLTEPYCRSILTEENGEAAARAIVCMDGVTHEAEKRASVTGLATLDYKRTITELVKTTVYDAAVPFLPQAPVWGSLTGVRPAKLARGMIERGMTRGEAAVELREHFHVSPERTALTIRAAATAMEMDKTIGENDISLYVGIPFCPSRCYYCSFVSATTAQSGKLIEPYLDTLCREIEETAALVRASGTGCFLLMNTGTSACESENGLLTTIGIHISGETQYALEGSVFVGGAVIQWLRDEMRFFSESRDAEYYAGKVKDTGGVYLVPAFTGLGAPHWDMYARGCL